MVTLLGLLLICGKQVIALKNTDPVVVGKTFLAGSTDPTTGSTGWALTSHGISEKLFTVNEKDEIVGQVAQSVKKVNKFTWDITLKSGYKFSDGTAVTAQNVADCLTELNQKNSNAKTSLDTMTVTAQSNRVVRIVSTRATHVMESVLAEYVFVIYKKTGVNFVFTGPYAVEKFVGGSYIDLIPNQHYIDNKASRRTKIKIKKFSSGDKLAKAVEMKEVDVGFHLPIHTIPDLKKKSGITVKSFEVGYHYMAFHNTRRPQMADLRVRKAIDLALDRTALAKALAGGKGTRSLFPDFSPYFSDNSDPKGNVVEAKQNLEAAGWTLSNGKRVKNGEILNVTLVAYPQRPGLPIMQPIISKALTDLGITVVSITTSGNNWNQLDGFIANKNFDLLMWAQHTLPAGDPLFFLNGFFRSDGGNNHAGLNDSVVDSLLDTLSQTEEHSARITACKAAHSEILSNVPVSNLVTPAWHVGLSTRMANYKPWGSDYYVIRADFYEVAPTDTTVASSAPIFCTKTSLILALVLIAFGIY